MQNIAAILLTAGQSRRMGAFKPLLPFGNQTVAQSCLNYLLQGGVETVIAVLGHRADELKSHLDHPAVRFAYNPDPASEMSTSIEIGIKQVPENASAVFIALVDYPAVPSSVVSSLIVEWSKGAMLVKPTWQGRGGHPVLVDLTLRNELQNLDPVAGLKSVFEKHAGDVRRLEVKSPYVAWDIDTWDDYSALYREIFDQTPPEPDSG